MFLIDVIRFVSWPLLKSIPGLQNDYFAEPFISNTTVLKTYCSFALFHSTDRNGSEDDFREHYERSGRHPQSPQEQRHQYDVICCVREQSERISEEERKNDREGVIHSVRCTAYHNIKHVLHCLINMILLYVMNALFLHI